MLIQIVINMRERPSQANCSYKEPEQFYGVVRRNPVLLYHDRVRIHSLCSERGALTEKILSVATC